jgi:hypothetical protein
MTPAKHVFTGVNDTGNACIAGVVDTVDSPVVFATLTAGAGPGI